MPADVVLERTLPRIVVGTVVVAGCLIFLLILAWRAGASRTPLNSRQGSGLPTVPALDVHSLLDSARSVTGEQVPVAPELALFVSDALLCPQAITEVSEYAALLPRLRPRSSVLFLLLETDSERAHHFAETRALNVPLFFDAAPELVAELHEQVRSFTSDFAPGNAALPTGVMPAALVFLDTASGEILGREFLFNSITDPRYKLLVVQHFRSAAAVGEES